MRKFMFIGMLIAVFILGGCNKSFECPKCDGDGHYSCLNCDASGKQNGKRCVHCYGVGIFTCDICDGTGKATEDDLPKVKTR